MGDLRDALSTLAGPTRRWLDRVWQVSLVVFLAFCLRLFHLTSNSLWLDEGFSVWLASHPVTEIIENAVSSEDEPLYYLLLHGWMNVASRSEWALRYLSVTLGVIAVPVAYAIGRVLIGHRVGLLSAGLEAVSPLSIWYAQEIGRFTLGLTLTLTATWMLVLGVQRRRVGWWIAYGLAATASLYTIYTAIGLLFLQTVVILSLLLFYEDHRAALTWRWLVGCGVIIVGFGPWVPNFLQQTRHVGGVSLFNYLRLLAARFGWQLEISRLPMDKLTLIALAFGLLVVMLSRLWVRVAVKVWQRHKDPVVGMWMLGHLLFLAVVAWRPVSSIRLLVPFAPYSLVVLAFLLSEGRPTWRSWRWLTIVAVGTVITLAVLFFGQQKEDWRGVAQLLRSETESQDLILLQPGFVHLPLGYYYDGPLPLTAAPYGNTEALAEISAKHERVWLVTGLYYLKNMRRDQLAQLWLDANLSERASADFSHVSVKLYDQTKPSGR